MSSQPADLTVMGCEEAKGMSGDTRGGVASSDKLDPKLFLLRKWVIVDLS